MKKIKALLLFSGGLDSILAAKILMEQGIKIVPVYFKSYFFGPEIAQKSANQLNLSLKIIDISKEHLKIVKKPRFGYGKAMNPCLDCHILMLKKAKQIMKKEGFDFIATGEILGERPMSQNRKALELIEIRTSLKGYLLRPLSAKLLKPTIVEKSGLINRENLLDIQGKSRKKQLELVKKFNIKEFPSPAGGCLLTDLQFSKRLRDLLIKFPNFNGNDVELLKLGRHFWHDKTKIIVGRNYEENLKIKKLARKNDILIEMKNYSGPITLVRFYSKPKNRFLVLKEAQKLTQYYSTKARKKDDVKFLIKTKK